MERDLWGDPEKDDLARSWKTSVREETAGKKRKGKIVERKTGMMLEEEEEGFFHTSLNGFYFMYQFYGLYSRKGSKTHVSTIT
jgi:hypothetical protein